MVWVNCAPCIWLEGKLGAQMGGKSLHAKCSTCNQANLDFVLGKRQSVYRVAKNRGQKLQHCPADCPDFSDVMAQIFS